MCRRGVKRQELERLLKDYSREASAPWPEDVLRALAERLGIPDPVRTYASYHARPRPMYLVMPGDPEARVRIDRDPVAADPYWEGFIQLEFMRV